MLTNISSWKSFHEFPLSVHSTGWLEPGYWSCPVPCSWSPFQVNYFEYHHQANILENILMSDSYTCFSGLTSLERSMRACMRSWSIRSRSRTWTCGRFSSRTLSSLAAPPSSKASGTDCSLRWRSWRRRTSRSGSPLLKRDSTPPGLEDPFSPLWTLSKRCGCQNGNTMKKVSGLFIAKPSSATMWITDSWSDQKISWTFMRPQRPVISNPNQTGGEQCSIVEMHFRAPSVSAVSTASVFSGVGWPSLPFSSRKQESPSCILSWQWKDWDTPTVNHISPASNLHWCVASQGNRHFLLFPCNKICMDCESLCMIERCKPKPINKGICDLLNIY